MICSVNLTLTHKMYQLPQNPRLCVVTFAYKAIAGQQSLTCVELILLIRGKDGILFFFKVVSGSMSILSKFSLCFIQSESSSPTFSLYCFPCEFFHGDMGCQPCCKSRDTGKLLFLRHNTVLGSGYIWVLLHHLSDA